MGTLHPHSKKFTSKHIPSPKLARKERHLVQPSLGGGRKGQDARDACRALVDSHCSDRHRGARKREPLQLGTRHRGAGHGKSLTNGSLASLVLWRLPGPRDSSFLGDPLLETVILEILEMMKRSPLSFARCSSLASSSACTGGGITGTEMSGRSRVPVGAMERGELFGNPSSTRTAPSSEADLRGNKDTRGDDVPRAVSRQQQPQQAGAGSAMATPYGALSPGRRRYTSFWGGKTSLHTAVCAYEHIAVS